MRSSQNLVEMKRYELPTCVLEVWSERSPLSEWTDQLVAQNLRFRLQIAQRLIKGNQKQLEKIIESVTTYVDNFLSQQEISSLNHTLLIPQRTRLKSKLQLSTLQLFDLLTSLEQCISEVILLPSLDVEARRLNLTWLKMSAALVITVGITTSAVRLVMPPQTAQIATNQKMAKTGESSDRLSSPPTASKPLVNNSQIPKRSESSNSASQLPSQPDLNLSSPSNPAIASSKIPPDSPATPTVNGRVSKTMPQPSSVPSKLTDAKEIPKPVAESTDQSNNNLGNAISSGSRAANPSPVISSKREMESAGTSPTQPSSQVPSSLSKPLRRDQSLSNSADSLSKPSGIQVIRVETSSSEQLTTSLTQYLQSLNSPKSFNTEIKVVIVFQQGKVEQVKFAEVETNLQNTESRKFIKQSLLHWQAPQPTNGEVTVFLKF